MAEFVQDSLIRAGFERVRTELEWYDGSRAGVADVGGVPPRLPRQMATRRLVTGSTGRAVTS